MKRIRRDYGIQLDPNACYKMEAVHERSERDFESVTGWLYLGADIVDKTFAKVGYTLGDLTARSSSSSNPNYYIFCAFKCVHDITKARIREIEQAALNYLDSLFCDSVGITNRRFHAESGVLSECYYKVDFRSFFIRYHNFLYDSFSNDFLISGFYTDFDEEEVWEGDFIDCEFHKLMSRAEINQWIRSVLQN